MSTVDETAMPVPADEPAHDRPRNVVFAAPADDPRTRRTSDYFVLAISAVVVALAGWSYASDPDIDRRVAGFFAGDLPDWLSASLTIVYIIGFLYSFVLLIGVLFFGQGRVAVARDMFSAGLLALFLAGCLALAAGPEWVDILPELLERDGFPSYPVVRLATAIAITRVAAPYLAAPMRTVGRRVMIGMAISALVMTYGTVTGVIGAVALGVGSAAVIHLVFGSGVGIPSKPRVRDALAHVGVEATDLSYAPVQPVGAALLDVRLVDGSDAVVRFYGRDASDTATAAKLWRTMWYRGRPEAITATPLQQVEHESLTLLHCKMEQAPAAELLAWGQGPAGDAFVVTAPVPGVPLDQLDEVSDETLEQAWRSLQALHGIGVAHGAIDASIVFVDGERVTFDGLCDARVTPDEPLILADVAQLLVATALHAGPDKAIRVAREVLGDDRLKDAWPYIQASALPTSLQADAKRVGTKLKAFRAAVADAIGLEDEDLVQLQRVTWSNVAMVVLTLVAASALISAMSDIGLDQIADEVADATWAWIIVALVLAQCTNIGEWLSITGMVHNNVPFGPTMMFRYATSFISLAVPSDAGELAMNIRYMRKLGETPAAAVAQGPLLTVVGLFFDVVLMLITSRIIGETVDLSDVDSGPALRLIVLIIVAVVVGVIVMFAVPKLRNQVLPHIKEGWRAVSSIVTDPERMLRVASGSLLRKLLFGMTLAASVAAYGNSISIAEAIFINTVISLFIGLIPVPGGIGVTEAALTAGLVALGVPESAALATAVTHRIVTAYLPPVFGWYAMKWLTQRDYL